MRHRTYAIGETVTLKADLFRSADSNRECRIVAILPADHGEAQYRIRLGSETYERRIVASDIEAPEATAEKAAEDSMFERTKGEPWFKPSSIRIRK